MNIMKYIYKEKLALYFFKDILLYIIIYDYYFLLQNNNKISFKKKIQIKVNFEMLFKYKLFL